MPLSTGAAPQEALGLMRDLGYVLVSPSSSTTNPDSRSAGTTREQTGREWQDLRISALTPNPVPAVFSKHSFYFYFFNF